jgi:biofilm PGA synthesis lipoprotein PgaB
MILGAAMLALAQGALADAIPVIAWHDIVERRGADEYAVTVAEFREQLRYLKEEGYTPVSLQQLDEARHGRAPLPPRPVLLTFDDGLASYATRALPLLRSYGYPSVLAVVTAWADGRSVPSHYQGRLLGWEELRRIAAPGDVEIVSHSDDLHRGLRSNPQGNQAPAVVTREYREPPGRYESEAEFRQRVRADLARSHARLLAELKQAPRAVAWPYGETNAVLIEEAAALGMTWHLTLDEEPMRLETLPRINRATFRRYRRLSDFDDMLTFRKHTTEQLRFVEIALDPFAGLAAEEQERRLSAVLTRLELLRVNAVIVPAFNRSQTEAFFHTSRVPVASDILNRVVHQIHVRNRVDHIYLRLPGAGPGRPLIGAYDDLARLNRFAGVLIAGPVTRTDVEALGTLFRRHNPAVKIGFEASYPEADLAWMELDAAANTVALETRIREASRKSARLMVLLRRADDLPDERLQDALRALRQAGVRHYGYDNDEFIRDAPALARIAPELRAHTIVTEGGR